MARKDTPYFEERAAELRALGYGGHGIRLLFQNGIVQDYNEGRMDLETAKSNYPAVEKHPCFVRRGT